MDSILEGTIDREHGIAEVFRTILDTGYFQRSTLSITSTDGSVAGSILIAKGSAIKGARLDTGPEVGYRALRSLLSLRQAYFTYEIGGDESMQIESSGLNADIAAIIRFLPDLPPSPSAQFVSDQTIPPNSTFRQELQALAQEQIRRTQQEMAAHAAEVAHGVERMKDLEVRSMILKSPLFWSCFALVLTIIFLWGPDIGALISTNNFAVGGKNFPFGAP
ncbi:MAG TPA: hypothetical protein V6D17_01940 [Candidatus Obscuribacterales bacterium]